MGAVYHFFKQLNDQYYLIIMADMMIFVPLLCDLYRRYTKQTDVFGLEEQDFYFFEGIGSVLGCISCFLSKSYLNLVLFIIMTFIFFKYFIMVFIRKKEEKEELEFQSKLKETVITVTDPFLREMKYEHKLPIIDMVALYENKTDHIMRNIMIRCPIPDDMMVKEEKEERDNNGKRYFVIFVKKLKPQEMIIKEYTLYPLLSLLGKEKHIVLESPEAHVFMDKKPNINEKRWVSTINENEVIYEV